MSMDRRAEAYARQQTPLVVNGYINAVRSGQSSSVPAEIRPAIEAFVRGGRYPGGVDVNDWIYRTLYEQQARENSIAGSAPVPETTGTKVAKAAGIAALGIGGALLKQGIALSRKGLFR